MKFMYNGALTEVTGNTLITDGWLKGSGIFETIKTVDGKPWALSRHMRRAVNSATKLNLALPNEETLRNAIDELLAVENHSLGALRVSFDSNGNWAAVHNLYEEKSKAAKLTVVTNSLISDGTPMKTFPYDHRLQILNKVVAEGFDEAIVVNANNKVCEGAVTNLLFQIDNKWCTPPLSDGVLPGVMRALVVEYFKVQVRSIDYEEIAAIQSGFLLSSLRIAQPIAAIGSRNLSSSDDFGAEIRAMALQTSVG